jgi:hypothetical protein
MEALREEEVLQLEEAVLKKLEEKLTPILHQVAVDAAKTAMHELRLDLMNHISRHEATIRQLAKSDAAMTEVARAR